MPLHLNLLHEIETRKAASRRDPLKIAFYILAAIVALFAGIYLWEVGKFASIKAENAKLKAEFDALDPKAREAESREKDLKQMFQTSELIVKGIEERFYWAPVLADFVKLVPREVQITKLGGNVQGEGVKRALLNFDGIAAGSDPRRVAEDLRQSLVEAFGKKYTNVTANFRQLEDNPTPVTLDGQSLPTAIFGISLTLQTVEQAAAPAPIPRRKQ